MDRVIGDTLPNAVGVAFSPDAVIAITVLLFCARGVRNSLAFILGWAAGLTSVVAISLAAADFLGSVSFVMHTPLFASLRLALGATMLMLAYRKWRARPPAGVRPNRPDWIDPSDTIDVPQAYGRGSSSFAASPKNIFMTLAAVMTVSESDLSAGETIGALSVFVVASLSVLTPLVLHIGLGERTAQLLQTWAAWLESHNSALSIVMLLALGVLQSSKALRVLLS
jgi:hypothetical protein